MMTAETAFITLHELQQRTGIPARWLTAEARAGRIPSIEPRRGQLLFPAEAAMRALERRAGATMEGGGDAE